MYTPPAYRVEDAEEIRRIIVAARLSTLVTATEAGLIATPLPMFFEPNEGPNGTLYAHLARANPQWNTPAIGEALAIFYGPEAYVTPSWYETKQQTGKVVPTWNYVAVHAYGPMDVFEDSERLLDVVSRLTNIHEGNRPSPWQVSDAPPAYVQSQLKGIVGVRMPLTRLEGKAKLNQKNTAADRKGVIDGLSASDDLRDRAVGNLVPR